MKGHFLFIIILVLLSRQGWCQDQNGQDNERQQQYLCPPNFIRLGHSCYHFSVEMTTWHNAHFACRDLASQLAALESQREDENVRTYLGKPEFASLNRWVGGIYNWSTRQWTWGSSAEVMPYNGFATSEFPSSSRWHCVYLSPDISYRWNHALCTSFMHYICETHQIRVLDPNEIIIEDPGNF
ncbi:perlucin-like protein [Homarus americanus]|uniref:perlucin-like protein n=1 Tax=Homarus americanus TaxID=6706 RepID=UPI001C449F98|nr:perlucin-like protein [Homarus americanus]